MALKVTTTYHASNQGTEAVRWPRVRGQPGLTRVKKKKNSQVA